MAGKKDNVDGKISVLRRRIDNIDSELLCLIEERINLVKDIGRLKKRACLGVYDPMREQEILERVCSKSRMDRNAVRQIFKFIIEYCRQDERVSVKSGKDKSGKIGKKISAVFGDENKAVAVLGPKGTFTESAAKKIFPHGRREYCGGVDEVFSLVESGKADYGVVAVENSLEGSVSKTMDSLIDYDVKICGEITLDINMCLMAKPETKKSEIKTIISHPHALAQCQDYLKRNFPKAGLRSSDSTAAAMSEVKGISGAAAIGLKDSAKTYNLAVLDENIQDDVSQTRFLVLSGRECSSGNKTSVIFAVKDEAGALYSVLREFADRRINLMKIESRPSKRRLGEYVFFTDFESGSISKVKEILDAIMPKVTFLKFLGSYRVY